MLSLMFRLGKKKQTLEETVLSIQNGDKKLQNDLIEQYKPFVAKTVSSVCKRYISENDDEFSIGLIAFNDAIEKYSPDKGSSLFAFAELVIKRKVIDFIRKEARTPYSVRLELQEHEEGEFSQSKIEADLSLDEYQKKIDQEHRREEIAYLNHCLENFSITFSEIIEQSPKHYDARQNAIKVALKLVEDDGLKAYLFTKRQLPVKQLEEKVQVSRKTIERNRKYIIAMAIILSGDFVYLKDYIKGVLHP
ncbi:RNA polymerase sigma factor SigI [Metabacillus malikii]|uniref:RNA polymerase sigma factor SigI n=1 Tax=Metabacillus malikii TaxID=1504265 RepID=A0ABT9ZB62_9BACI|nr:RNA polymerase sigma factor SigI [Metabacillus malikii]MDQ0229457.1 RNA polymerase sigma factor [Metabacillus malikii]